MPRRRRLSLLVIYAILLVAADMALSSAFDNSLCVSRDERDAAA